MNVSLKNFVRIDVPAEIACVIEAHFEGFVDSDVCRWCGYPDRWGRCWDGLCSECRQSCTHEKTVVGYIIKRNGSQQVREKCVRCNREAGGGKYSPKRGAEYLDVCLADLRSGDCCERCGSTEGVEYHHYAPRNVFEDADRWATGYLCVDCHREWHQTMDGYLWHGKRQPPMREVVGQLAPPRIGERVRHKHFGIGTVTRLEDGGEVAVIQFNRHGVRRITVAYDVLEASA